MSQENVEVLQRMFAAYNSRDIEATLDALDPDIEWQSSDIAVERQTYRGHAAVRGFFEDNLDMWEDHHVEPEEFIDAGEHVVVPIRLSGRGRVSGVQTEARFVQVWTVRGGKVTRLRNYVDRTEALEAAGLSEQDAHADS
jgi:ketosteroid isomerase-like protein